MPADVSCASRCRCVEMRSWSASVVTADEQRCIVYRSWQDISHQRDTVTPFVHAKRATQTNCLFAMIKRDQLLTANKRSTHDGLQPAPERSLARPCRLVMGPSSVFRLQQLSNIEQLSKNATKNRNCYFRTHVPPSNFFIALTIRISLNYSDKRTYSRPVASLLIALGRFPQILDLFQDLKIEVPSGCLGETSIF